MNASENVAVEVSRYSFADTVGKLEAAIHAAGATLFASIDQAAAAAGAGLSLRPTTLLVYGNPKAGTPLMEAFPLAALDLPLKFLVWEAEGTVSVAYVPVQTILSRYDVTGKEQLAQGLEHAVAALLGAIT